MKSKEKKHFISVAEAARIIGVSRVQIWRLIKNGDIPAAKVGRSYVIDARELGYTGIYKKITPKQKQEVDKAVSRTVKQYGDVLKKLGRG